MSGLPKSLPEGPTGRNRKTEVRKEFPQRQTISHFSSRRKRNNHPDNQPPGALYPNVRERGTGPDADSGSPAHFFSGSWSATSTRTFRFSVATFSPVWAATFSSTVAGSVSSRWVSMPLAGSRTIGVRTW